jgi:hypothetical protein
VEGVSFKVQRGDELLVASVPPVNAWKGARGGGGRHPGLLKHLSRDDLVLYHYGEIRTAPAEAHLSVCRDCSDRLRAMRRDLERLTLPPRADGGGAAERASNSGRPSVWRRLLARLALAGSDRRS